MKVLSVEDYNDFECVGDRCPITCCGGAWTILVDEESAKRYRSVEGEFGDKLRAALIEREEKTFFQLDGKGDCVFLDERRLCDIYKNLGPDSLCYVCKTYPRQLYKVGDILFCYLTNSCPEVTKRILQRNEPLQVILNDSDLTSVEEEIDWQAFNYAIRAYTTGMDLLQNRQLKVKERVALLMTFLSQFQEMMNQRMDPSGLLTVFSSPEVYCALLSDLPIRERDYKSKIKAFMLVFRSLLSVSYDHPMWRKCKDLGECLAEGKELDLDGLKNAFTKMDDEEMQIEAEQLLTYRFFAVFMQGFRDSDYFEKMAYECVLYAALQSYIAMTEVVQSHACTQEERVLFYSLCSRTDHSQDRKHDLINKIRSESMNSLESIFNLIS